MKHCVKIVLGFVLLMLLTSCGFSKHEGNSGKHETSGVTSQEEYLQGKEIVEKLISDFYNGKNMDALDELVAENFIENNPDLQSGRDGMKASFTEIFTEFPDFYVDNKRLVQDGDFVFAHSQNTISPEDIGNDFAENSQAVIDVYRIEKGMIAEHWEAIQNVNPETVNGNSMFNGTSFQERNSIAVEANKKVAASYFDELFNKGNFDHLDEIMVEDFVAHNPIEPNGRQELKEFLAGMGANLPSPISVETIVRGGEGNFVFNVNKYSMQGVDDIPGYSIDILAFNQEGKIIEHWDVLGQDFAAAIGEFLEKQSSHDEHDHDEELGGMSMEEDLTELVPGVYHYYNMMTSSLVAESDEGFLVVDIGNDYRAQALKAKLAEIAPSKQVKKIILTHEHYDHAGGTGLFPEAQIVCHESCQQFFKLDPTGQTPRVVHETFSDVKQIPWGNNVIDLEHLAPGDGVATTIISVPDHGIVMTADMYEPRGLTNADWIEDKNFLGVRKILNTLGERDLKYVINSHFTGTNPKALHENREYYNDLYDAVYAEYEKALTSENPAAIFEIIQTLPETIRLDKYRDWEGYEEHFPEHVNRMYMSIMHGG